MSYIITGAVCLLVGIAATVLVVAKHPVMALKWIKTYVTKGKATWDEIEAHLKALKG